MKILLAEDDPNIATVIQLALEHLGGHEVTIASDGEKALELALSQVFDLLLLDGMMPKKNGLKVCKEYLEQAKQPAPIIFLSAKSQKSDIREFLAAGTGYIQKPFAPTKICELINEILKEQKDGHHAS